MGANGVSDWKLVSAVALLVGGVWGCQPKTTQFDIIDYRGPGAPDRYFQAFDECYYCLDPEGNLDMVALHRSPGTSGAPTTQLVHVETFWVSVPGRTRVDVTMINALVSYWIVSGPVGASFEGSGFVSFDENRNRSRLTGHLELSSLSPQRRLGPAERLFERAELSGRFVAKRNKAKVISLLHDMRRRFGPLPEYAPPPDNPDLR